MNTMPRRNQLNLNEPSEVAINDALKQIELLGTDERLTKSVMLLSEAKNLVSDFIDECLQNSMKTLGSNR